MKKKEGNKETKEIIDSGSQTDFESNDETISEIPQTSSNPNMEESREEESEIFLKKEKKKISPKNNKSRNQKAKVLVQELLAQKRLVQELLAQKVVVQELLPQKVLVQGKPVLQSIKRSLRKRRSQMIDK